jgi:hypothetical protein
VSNSELSEQFARVDVFGRHITYLNHLVTFEKGLCSEEVFLCIYLYNCISIYNLLGFHAETNLFERSDELMLLLKKRHPSEVDFKLLCETYGDWWSKLIHFNHKTKEGIIT